MTEVLLRSRLPAPPPQCLSMRRRVARTIERQTLTERAWRSSFGKAKRRRSPKGGPRISDRARPGCLPCARDGITTKKHGLTRGFQRPEKKGAAQTRAWRSLPGWGGRGERRSPRPEPAALRSSIGGRRQKERAPEGAPRDLSRLALDIIPHHAPKVKDEKHQPPGRGERPQRGRRPAPRRGGGRARAAQARARARRDRTRQRRGGPPERRTTPRRAPREARRGRGRRRPAREREKGTGAAAQGRPVPRKGSPQTRGARTRKPIPPGGRRDDARGPFGAPRRPGPSAQREAPEPEGRADEEGAEPPAPEGRRRRQAAGGWSPRRRRRHRPEVAQQGGSGGDQRRPDPPRGPTMGGARDEAQPRGNRLSPKRLREGDAAGCPPRAHWPE